MNDLFVAPDARGSGVAEALIAACRDACAAHGAADARMADGAGQRARADGL